MEERDQLVRKAILVQRARLGLSEQQEDQDLMVPLGRLDLLVSKDQKAKRERKGKRECLDEMVLLD